jgi:hypothetical protein
MRCVVTDDPKEFAKQLFKAGQQPAAESPQQTQNRLNSSLTQPRRPCAKNPKKG